MIGYKVIFGVIIIRIFNRSVTNVFGLMFDKFFQGLKISPIRVSFVSNLTLIIFNFTGIFAGFALKFVSVKLVTVIGTLFVSGGLILTSVFAKSFAAIVFTYRYLKIKYLISAIIFEFLISVLVGIGIGLISISCLLVVVSCFKKRRNQAVSISLTGSTIGDVILPQVVGYLLMYYGLKTAVFTVGLLALLGTLSAILFFPPGKLNSLKNLPSEESLLLENLEKTQKLIDLENQSILKKVFNFMDLDLLQEKKFLILTTGISIGYSVSADFGLIFPFFLKV